MTMPIHRYLPHTVLDTVKKKILLEPQLLINVDINERDKDGSNALFWAINNKNIHNARLLVNYGIDLVVIANKHAIFHAIENNHYELIVFLLQNGISPNIINKNGQTELMYAIKKEKFKIICLLVRNGAYLTGVDNQNQSIEYYIQQTKSQDIKDFMRHIFNLNEDSDKNTINSFCNFCEDSKC